MKTLVLLFALVLPFQSFAGNTIAIPQAGAIKIVRALLYSGVKPTITATSRSIKLKSIVFRQSNGHVCDDPANIFCGFGDPMEWSGQTRVKEIVQLEMALSEVLQPLYKKNKIQFGEVAAGTAFWDYGSITCNWSLDATQTKIKTADCTATSGAS